MNSNSLKIHFILEGNEEETLFQIIEILYPTQKIEMTYHNSKIGGRIPFYFQSALQSDNYDLIYCVYDVDYKADKTDSMFSRVRKGLFSILGNEKEVEKVSLCTNPNILLLFLIGYDDVSKFENMTSGKAENTAIISKYNPKIGNKKDYDASGWQLDLLKDDFLYSKIASIDNAIKQKDKISQDCKKKIIGTNLLPVIEALKNDNIEFFIKLIDE